MQLKAAVFFSSSSLPLSFPCTQESCSDECADTVWAPEVALTGWDSHRIQQSRCSPLLIKVLRGVTCALILPWPTRSPQKATAEKQLPSSKLQTFFPPSLEQIKAAATSLKWDIWVVKVRAKGSKLVLSLDKDFYHTAENCQCSGIWLHIETQRPEEQ